MQRLEGMAYQEIVVHCELGNPAYLVVHQTRCHLAHCLLSRSPRAKEDSMGGGEVLQSGSGENITGSSASDVIRSTLLTQMGTLTDRILSMYIRTGGEHTSPYQCSGHPQYLLH